MKHKVDTQRNHIHTVMTCMPNIMLKAEGIALAIPVPRARSCLIFNEIPVTVLMYFRQAATVQFSFVEAKSLEIHSFV